jgi:hypothetical protein
MSKTTHPNKPKTSPDSTKADWSQGRGKDDHGTESHEEGSVTVTGVKKRGKDDPLWGPPSHDESSITVTCAH